jgi:hypothetical protein
MKNVTMTAKEMLELFCAGIDEGRNILCNPFNQGEYTYATNGHFAIRFPKIEGYDVEGAPDIEKVWPKAIPTEEQWVDIPDIENIECECCDGKGIGYICPDCEGRSRILFTSEYGYEYSVECRMCNGTGNIKAKCKDCMGTGRASTVDNVNIKGTLFDANLLIVLKLLPCVKIAPEAVKKYTAVPFKFDGGEGLIMPKRGYDNEH